MGAAMIGFGTVIQGTAGIMQNMEAASAEREAARFYEMQAERVKTAHERKLRLLSKDQRDFTAKQQGIFAKNGISFSGSALEVLSQSKAEQYLEFEAAKQEAQWDVQSVQMQAGKHRAMADSYSSFTRNFLQTGGTLMSGFSRMKGA